MGERRQDVFALVFESGRAETITSNGVSGSGPLSDYWQVLERIATAFNCGGFSSDYPKALLRNGERVEGSAIALATQYLTDLVNERELAAKRVRAKHRPAWEEAPADA